MGGRFRRWERAPAGRRRVRRLRRCGQPDAGGRGRPAGPQRGPAGQLEHGGGERSGRRTANHRAPRRRPALGLHLPAERRPWWPSRARRGPGPRREAAGRRPRHCKHTGQKRAPRSVVSERPSSWPPTKRLASGSPACAPAGAKRASAHLHRRPAPQEPGAPTRWPFRRPASTEPAPAPQRRSTAGSSKQRASPSLTPPPPAAPARPPLARARRRSSPRTSPPTPGWGSAPRRDRPARLPTRGA
jgi:hypothetical protein